MKLISLHIYPVKGCRGIALREAQVDNLGLVGDRRFLVVDESGRFLTQRTHPRMALIETTLQADSLTLSSPDSGPIAVALQDPQATLRSVDVWADQGLQAEDCGEPSAAWLSSVLETRCRLVRIGASFHRPIRPDKAQPGDVVMFADAYPFLLLSEATLDALNDRLVAQEQPAVPMDRFRPNFVVAGAAPHAEDTWHRFTLGTVVFRAAGPCARCIVTTTDQRTGERGKEPLRTLASYRRNPADPTRIDFGQNLIHETKTGSVQVGDEIVVTA